MHLLTESLKTAAAPIVAALICLTPAYAAVPIPSLAGAWTFATSKGPSGCTISGNALLRDVGGGTYQVALHAFQRCPDGAEYRAEEICTAKRKADVVAIACALKHPVPDYAPDEFALKVHSPSLMRGRLFDRWIWDAPVVWRKAGDGLVS
jgi:CxxC motif-containing protein